MVLKYSGGQQHIQEDLFASRESAHLPVYFSIDRKDRRAAGINAQVQRWKFKKKYAFPPPQLIPLISAKIRDFGGSQLLILITPFWTRSAWLPELLQLSIQPPLLLPDCPDTVMDLNRGNAIPSLSKLRLTPWLLCSEYYGKRGPIICH